MNKATLLFALLLGGCASVPAPISSERIAEILASPDRRPADRTNDIRRKPAQMLAFIGVRPGMVALDLSAGGGYTTELIARAIGPAGVIRNDVQAARLERGEYCAVHPRAIDTEPAEVVIVEHQGDQVEPARGDFGRRRIFENPHHGNDVAGGGILRSFGQCER